MGTPSETKSFEEVRGRVYQRVSFYTGYEFVSMTAVTQGKDSAQVESTADQLSSRIVAQWHQHRLSSAA